VVCSFAIALATHDIRVNAVAPGMVDAAMTAATLTDPITRPQRLARIPLRRFGRPQDVAETVCFLLSDATSWLTGTTLTLDGGQTIGTGLT
jgi:NAD(P)-dependent dehydrogenase (short-subunit alcohol dehydrogenase family)